MRSMIGGRPAGAVWIALLLVACNPSDPLMGRLARVEQERNRLRAEAAAHAAEAAAHERYIAEETQELNEVQDSIDSVRRDLHVVHVNLGPSLEAPVGGEGQKQTMMEDIAGIRSAVTANLQRLSDMEARYRGSVAEVKLLRSMVKGLQSEVEEQQRDLARMEQTIHELSDKIAAQDEELQRKNDTIRTDEDTINLQRQRLDEAATGYVRVGSVDDLWRNGLIEAQRSGFLGKVRWRLRRNIDKRSEVFQRVDTTQVRNIQIPAPPRAIEVLSTHPASSYHIDPDGARSSILTITDPAGFWQFGFAVILIGR